MKRRFEVELTCSVTIEIDDTAVSDHNGTTILEAHADPERFIEGTSRDTALGGLAVSVGVDGRRVSNTDGWADFPDEAVTSRGFPQWDVASVDEVPA